MQNDIEVDLRITQTFVNDLKRNILTGFFTMPEEFQKKFSGIIPPAFFGPEAQPTLVS